MNVGKHYRAVIRDDGDGELVFEGGKRLLQSYKQINLDDLFTNEFTSHQLSELNGFLQSKRKQEFSNDNIVSSNPLFNQYSLSNNLTNNALYYLIKTDSSNNNNNTIVRNFKRDASEDIDKQLSRSEDIAQLSKLLIYIYTHLLDFR